MTVDIEKLKTLALAAMAREGGWKSAERELSNLMTPAAVLELIAEVERLRTMTNSNSPEFDGIRNAAPAAGTVPVEKVIEFSASLLGDASETDALDEDEARVWVMNRWISSGGAAGTERDVERLNFMITEECHIEHMSRPGAAPLYRVRWPWGDIAQLAWSASGREAIDAAIEAHNAGSPSCGP